METLNSGMDDFEKTLAQRLQAPPVDVPDAVDEAILGRAARTLRWRRWRPRIEKLAASLLLGVVVFLFWRSEEPRIDVDADGRVDIVDAYVLALRIRGNEPIRLHFDINEDGQVDLADVREIARRSVSLEGA